ncbi:MAG: hypothetical protein U0Q18_37120 [Bryobacteraceae bacterium]
MAVPLSGNQLQHFLNFGVEGMQHGGRGRRLDHTDTGIRGDLNERLELQAHGGEFFKAYAKLGG